MNGISIVDAHHHIWRRADLPWLSGPMRPRIFGPYEAIRRDYPMDEFLADIAGTGVTRSVYVQANWAPKRFEDEVAWVEWVADESGWRRTRSSATPTCSPRMRAPSSTGSRATRVCAESACSSIGTRTRCTALRRDPTLALDPVLQRNVARLADYGLVFDLQVFARQMPGAAALASGVPGGHFRAPACGYARGSVTRRATPSGVQAWKRCLRNPTSISKLSAFGTFIHRNDPAHIARIFRETVEIFGAERCLFGSNFPIEKLWTNYRALLDAFLAASAPFDDEARKAIFEGTAARVYRL